MKTEKPGMGIVWMMCISAVAACASESAPEERKSSGGEDTDSQTADDSETSSASDTASDTASDIDVRDTTSEKESPCGEECDPANPVYSACTCAPDDPCGWISDGKCDASCISKHIVTEMFDDVGDCSDCSGDCESSIYTACTCNIYDPCNWAENDFCDSFCMVYTPIGEMFDDSKDCGVCSGLCALGIPTTCTCGPDDPCDRSNDGWCDDICLTDGIVEEMFDDSEDCS